MSRWLRGQRLRRKTVILKNLDDVVCLDAQIEALDVRLFEFGQLGVIFKDGSRADLVRSRCGGWEFPDRPGIPLRDRQRVRLLGESHDRSE